MAVEDLWLDKAGEPTKRHGRGLRYRVRWRGFPTKAFARKGPADRYWLKIRSEPAPKAAGTSLVAELVARWLLTKKGLSKRGYEACWGASRHIVGYWGEWVAAEQ